MLLDKDGNIGFKPGRMNLFPLFFTKERLPLSRKNGRNEIWQLKLKNLQTA